MGNYAVSDLHSCYEQWKQIQSFCKDSDRIYVLGDCVDRGLRSLDTLKSVLGDSRTTLIRGNHEDMMLKALIAERDFEEEPFLILATPALSTPAFCYIGYKMAVSRQSKKMEQIQTDLEFL